MDFDTSKTIPCSQTQSQTCSNLSSHSWHRLYFVKELRNPLFILFQTKQILERHVIRAGRAYTVSDLKLLANETHPFVLPTSRDPLRLRVKESDKSKLLTVDLHRYLRSRKIWDI